MMPLTPTRRAFMATVIGASIAAVAGEMNVRAAERGELAAQIAKPGHIVLMRHALAPGTGDPSNFTLGDCATQRNLSEAGRRQARRTGEFLRGAGVRAARVFSSEWCRCLETARLLDLGPVEPLPALNSFFEERASGPAQTRELRAEIAEMDLSRPVVMVTHQVNITALTRVFPSSGEMVVLKRKGDGTIEVLGTIEPRDTD